MTCKIIEVLILCFFTDKMAKNKNKKQGGTGPQKPKISQTKKDKNVFKVADGNRLKKAKQVQSSVKSVRLVCNAHNVKQIIYYLSSRSRSRKDPRKATN